MPFVKGHFPKSTLKKQASGCRFAFKYTVELSSNYLYGMGDETNIYSIFYHELQRVDFEAAVSCDLYHSCEAL